MWRELLSSLPGLVGSPLALGPTVETVGFFRVSLPGQKPRFHEVAMTVEARPNGCCTSPARWRVIESAVEDTDLGAPSPMILWFIIL